MTIATSNATTIGREAAARNTAADPLSVRTILKPQLRIATAGSVDDGALIECGFIIL